MQPGLAYAGCVLLWEVRTVTTSGTVILCYHRVAEGAEDPFGLCVSPDNFAAHLDELVRRREPSTLDDLSAPSRRTRVVVTFDDGYSDNLTNALPIAASKGVPITVFVTSGLLSGHTGFWWDRLAVLLRSRPPSVREFCLTAGGRTFRIAVDGSDFDADLSNVRRHLLPLSVPEIESALDAVSESWSVGSTPPPDARAMTPAELLQLAAADCVTIGAHTVDHVRLSGRQEHEQIETITASRTDLEQFLDAASPNLPTPSDAVTISMTFRLTPFVQPILTLLVRPCRVPPDRRLIRTGSRDVL